MADDRPGFLVPNFGNDWLSSIHEISLPATVGWLPYGPLWWTLFLFVVLGVVYRLWQAYGRYCANFYRRQALEQLSGIDALWQHSELQLEKREAACRQLAQLIRRVALTAWPRVETASIVGQAWLDFLQQSLCDKNLADHRHAEAPPQELSSLSYLPAAELNTMPEARWHMLIVWVAAWIETHKGEQA